MRTRPWVCCYRSPYSLHNQVSAPRFSRPPWLHQVVSGPLLIPIVESNTIYSCQMPLCNNESQRKRQRSHSSNCSSTQDLQGYMETIDMQFWMMEAQLQAITQQLANLAVRRTTSVPSEGNDLEGSDVNPFHRWNQWDDCHRCRRLEWYGTGSQS